MCGIVGYIGPKPASDVLIHGLERLEYRGYDSAGVAIKDQSIQRTRAVGRVQQLKDKLTLEDVSGCSGIAHTRWATHGEPNEQNTHPHADQNQRFFVVHNGIIENERMLRQELVDSGYNCLSDTDSEVLVQLVARYYDQGYSFNEAVKKTLSRVQGTYGVLFLSQDEDEMIAARKGSPLILGVRKEEYIIASDLAAISPYTRDMIFLEDSDVVTITSEGYQVQRQEERIQPPVHTVDTSIEEYQKDGYDFFMHKEIYEQPEALRRTLKGRIDWNYSNVHMRGLHDLAEHWRTTRRIVIISCGSSFYAGSMGAQWIEEMAGIPVQTEIASEFRYASSVIDQETMVIGISQSGETADTIAALQEAQEQGATVFSIVNVVGSTIARMSDAGAYTHAGPEIGVASTKSFLTQVMTLLLLAVYLGRKSGLSAPRGSRMLTEITKIPDLLHQSIPSLEEQIQNVVPTYASYQHMLYLGRQIQYPIALEGALKLKEISYIHAEGYGTGEMKHGPLALIDENFPSLVCLPQDGLYQKTMSNIQEIRARKGPIIVLATQGDTAIQEYVSQVIYLPQVSEVVRPFLEIVVMQLFAYHMALEKGYDPDKPRNLAKSVTVE